VSCRAASSIAFCSPVNPGRLTTSGFTGTGSGLIPEALAADFDVCGTTDEAFLVLAEITTDATIFDIPDTFSSMYSSCPVDAFWRRLIDARCVEPVLMG